MQTHTTTTFAPKKQLTYMHRLLQKYASPGCLSVSERQGWHGCAQAAALTGALGARDESLARVAHLEDGGRLDVVPLLEGHGVHAAVGRVTQADKGQEKSQERCSPRRCNISLQLSSPYIPCYSVTAVAVLIPKKAATLTSIVRNLRRGSCVQIASSRTAVSYAKACLRQQSRVFFRLSRQHRCRRACPGRVWISARRCVCLLEVAGQTHEGGSNHFVHCFVVQTRTHSEPDL